MMIFEANIQHREINARKYIEEMKILKNNVRENDQQYDFGSLYQKQGYDFQEVQRQETEDR